jgi:chromosomal replication initiator protein
MDRWEIRPNQTADDPDRHLLLMRGGPADVAALLKKFGGLLGRPAPYQGQDYNLSLVVHRLNSGARERLENWLRNASPAVRAAASPAPSIAPEPAPAPASFTLESPPAAVPPVPEMPMLIPLAPEPTATGLPVLESAPVVPVPIPLPMPPDTVPPPTAPLPASVVPMPVPAPAASASLGFALAPRSDWTMETMLVGAYNRFAHAAATQVISSPGTMYNPLFLFGVPGTGKSHLLHAIAAALSKGMSGADMFVTTGPLLSRGVNAAMASQTMGQIDKKVADSKALLVDDIHLMAVSDENKGALGNIFKSFFDRRLQVVITSGYPPRALGSLEEALKFTFSKGWSVDLKVPSPTAQKDLIIAANEKSGGKFSADELALLYEKFSQWGYQELGLWLRRLATFKEMREVSGQASAAADLFPLIYDPILIGGGEPPRPGAPFSPPPAAPGAAPLAVILPKDQIGLSTFLAGLFHETAAKYGFLQSYRHALWESYDSQQPFGAPFMIGDICRNAGVTRALVLGPTPESALGPRSAEFAHAVRRILDNIDVEMGWIPYSGITTHAHYLNAHLDFASASRPR